MHLLSSAIVLIDSSSKFWFQILKLLNSGVEQPVPSSYAAMHWSTVGVIRIRTHAEQSCADSIARGAHSRSQSGVYANDALPVGYCNDPFNEDFSASPLKNRALSSRTKTHEKFSWNSLPFIDNLILLTKNLKTNRFQISLVRACSGWNIREFLFNKPNSIQWIILFFIGAIGCRFPVQLCWNENAMSESLLLCQLQCDSRLETNEWSRDWTDNSLKRSPLNHCSRRTIDPGVCLSAGDRL